MMDYTSRRSSLWTGVRPSSGAASLACSTALEYPALFQFQGCCARGRAHSGQAENARRGDDAKQFCRRV